MAALERLTRVQARDCVGDERKLVFVVGPGQVRQALRDREGVQRLESILKRKVKLVEASPDPAKFLARAFAPVEVRSVTVEERSGVRKATVEVPKVYRGVAVGKGGHNIALVRQLAKRHFGIDEVVVGDPPRGERR